MELKETEKFIKYIDITSRECYDYYRENRKKAAPSIDEYNRFVKVVKALTRTMVDVTAASQGGLYIDNLGYFCNVLITKKYYNRNKLEKVTSVANQYYKKNAYTGFFNPHKNFENWCMDYTFSNNFILKSGKVRDDYKLHFDICESYSVNKHSQRVETNTRPFKRIL